MMLLNGNRILLVLVWCVVWATTTNGVTTGRCYEDRVGRGYRQQLQASESSTSIMGIDVYWKTNDLYYVKYVKDRGCVFYTKELGNKTERLVGELNHDWCKVTVHQENGALYAGCISVSSNEGGVYKFDSNSNRFERLDQQQFYARLVRFSKVLYYLDSDGKLKTFVRGVSQPVTSLWNRTIEDFIVESSGDIVFRSDGDLCVLKEKTNEIVQILPTTSLEHFALGPNGDIYGCDYYATYHINIASTDISRVIDAPLCQGLAVDKDGGYVYLSGNREVFHVAKCTLY